jgi:hypothetical protein
MMGWSTLLEGKMGQLIKGLALGIATTLAITVVEPLKTGEEATVSMISAMTAGALVALAVWIGLSVK